MPWMPEQPKREAQTRRARWNGYNTQRWRRLRRIILALNPLCAECSRIASVVDHIQPVRMGGAPFDSDNLQPLCKRCHDSKSGREAHQPRTYGRPNGEGEH